MTSSENKIDEVAAYFAGKGEADNARLTFCPVRHDVQEIMHPELEAVVRSKALEAYKYLRQPCVVEHGGLFFEGLRELPGPLGKIIWNAVGERMRGFLEEFARGGVGMVITGVAGAGAIGYAVLCTAMMAAMMMLMRGDRH